MIPTEIVIEVGQDDIDNGEPGDCVFCPIALAVKRQLQGADVSVSEEDILAIIDGNEYIFVSDSLRQFITDFDAGRPVHPMTITATLSYTGMVQGWIP